MDLIEYPSKLLEQAVSEFAKLPGVGRKTALRYVLHLLKKEEDEVAGFSEAIRKVRTESVFCEKCHNISDSKICSICSDKSRDSALICVVETIRDILSIENTQQYFGVYHVLGGVISPMDGIGPSDLNINSLIERVETGEVKEIVFALSTTMEGDTTNFYIYRKLSEFSVKVTSIARGVAFGDDLEYTDEITLGRSIKNRQEFSVNFQ